ncbi:MAG: hypothetical protein WB608_13400, partial [Terracidiphilus sp.]
VSSGPAKSRTYTASNGFGAVQEATEHAFREYNLLIVNSSHFPFSDRVPRRISVMVPMPPEKARAVKRQIQMLAVCKLVQPYLSSVLSQKSVD